MTNKKIITVMLLVTIIHFLVSSVIGYYIAVKIGTQIGQIVAGGLTETNDKKSEEDANRIYQNMKTKSDGILERWKFIRLLISLPAKPLMNPFLGELRKNQINRVIAKEITKEQLHTKGTIIDYTANFLNLLSLGLLVYIILRIPKYKEMKT